jgi:cytosine deaminase
MTERRTLENVRIPKSLLRDPKSFGGVEEGDCLVGALIVEGGKIRGLRTDFETKTAPSFVLPKLTECHAHLDKCRTFARLNYTGGDLEAAILAQAEDRDQWTQADVRRRASTALDDLVLAGCGTVRSHVDWTHGAAAQTAPLAWHVLNELAQDRKDEIALQCAPLVSIENLADVDTARTIAEFCVQSSGVLGAFVFGQEGLIHGIENAFSVAQTHGLALDFHVDEGLDPSLNGLEVIADAALAQGFEGPVLCGHACSLAAKPSDIVARIGDKLAKAGITVAILPPTNLYLQGRTAKGTGPRGLAPIKHLQRLGVEVVLGTDNVQDAFFPLGQFDPRRTLELAISAAHLDPPFSDHLTMITTAAESAIGLSPTWIDDAMATDLLVFDAQSTAEFLTSHKAPTSLETRLKGPSQ